MGCWVLVFFCHFSVSAQPLYSIWENNQLLYESSDSLQSIFHANKIINSWHQKGFLMAGRDSVSYYRVYLHKGSKISLIKYKKVNQLIKNAVTKIHKKWNNGYPFARLVWYIQTDSIDSHQSLTYAIHEGPFIVYDSVVNISNTNIKDTYLQKALSIRKGMPFSEKTFSNMPQNLLLLKYYEAKSQPDVSFHDGKAYTYLNLENRKSNTIQGILGILSNQNTQKPLLTGDIQLELGNLFKSGKEFNFSWNRYDVLSQTVDIQYFHPFILSNKSHAALSFYLMKQDTSFSIRKINFEFSTTLTRNILVGIGYSLHTSNMLTADDDKITPSQGEDFNQNWYSLHLKKHQLILQEFKNFFSYNLTFALGRRTLFLKNTEQQSHNFSLTAGLEWQKTFGAFQALHAQAQAHSLSGEITPNQAIRVGGNKTVRGFNENFFYANHLFYTRWEWRLFFESQSFVYLFTDQGAIWNPRVHWVMGNGLGLAVHTQSGQFNLALALGHSSEISTNLSNIKVHLGYLSRF